MIRAMILDVDGVIIGEKIGYNSPWPNSKVVDKLRLVRESGIPIILCTAKPHFAIDKIITDAKLNNLHITDGGGVVTDPINNKTLFEHDINSVSAKQVLKTLLNEGIYTEFYTLDNYFVDQSQVNEITSQHRHVIQQDAIIVDDLVGESQLHKVTKIMPIALNEEDKVRVAKIMTQFDAIVKTSWGVHPVILPLQFGIVTALGISKNEAALKALDNMNISPMDVLGVGDSDSDWQFMEICGYTAAMGNASEGLQDLVSQTDKGYIGDSVDDNGIICIIDHYLGQE